MCTGKEGIGLIRKTILSASHRRRGRSGPSPEAPFSREKPVKGYESIKQLIRSPANFGALSNQLLIGDFGNGHINAYNPTTGELIDKVRNPLGQAIVIDGLWSLRVGSNTDGSPNFGPNTVFFTAGPNGEQDGLFGAITSAP